MQDDLTIQEARRLMREADEAVTRAERQAVAANEIMGLLGRAEDAARAAGLWGLAVRAKNTLKAATLAYKDARARHMRAQREPEAIARRWAAIREARGDKRGVVSVTASIPRRRT